MSDELQRAQSYANATEVGNEASKDDRAGRRNNRPRGDRSGGPKSKPRGAGQGVQKALYTQIKDLEDRLQAEVDHSKQIRKDSADALRAKIDDEKIRNDALRANAIKLAFKGDGIMFSRCHFMFSSRVISWVLMSYFVASVINTFRTVLFGYTDHSSMHTDNYVPFVLDSAFIIGVICRWVIMSCLILMFRKYIVKDFVAFGVRHTYKLGKYEEVEIPDMRSIGMSAGDMKIKDPHLMNIVHSRAFVCYFPGYPLDFFEFRFIKFAVKQFIASMEILTEICLPKNLSISESEETVCSRLKYSSYALHGVNYNKYLNVNTDGNVHDNSMEVAFGIYLSNCEIALTRPFLRDAGR